MRNALHGIGSAAAAAVLTEGAWRYGLFFDEPFYRLASTLCIGGLAVVGIFGWQRMRADRRHSRIELTDIRPAVSGLLFAALLYAFALLHEPASVLGTLQQAFRYCAYAAYMLLLYAGFGPRGRRVWLSAALQASGIVVVGCALAGWMGALSFPAMIMTTGDGRVSAVGARLGGFLQYPNFLGAAALAYLVWSWLLLVRTGTRWVFGLAACSVLPYFLVGLLTESRGAWLAASVVWAAGAALMRGKGRIGWLLYSGWTLLCGGAACRVVVGAGLRGPGNGTAGGATVAEALLLLLLFAVSAAGLFGLRRFVHRSETKQNAVAAWAGWVLSIAGLGLLLPPAIYGRMTVGSTGGGTAGARELFYRDAWRLFREAPLFGRGGDAWRSLFAGVQSQPYVGNEVHNGYLEVALDLGAVGAAAGVVIMAVLLRPVWKSDRTGLLPIGVLLLHAAIDFDMSFGYYWLLLTSWIVYYSSGPDEAKEVAAAGRVGQRGRRFWRGARAATLAAAAACFAAGALLGWRFDAAARHREAAAAVSGAARTAALRAALEANPYWTRIRLELAVQAPPPERAALLAAGLRYEPQSVPLLWALGRQSAERKDVRGAAAYMRRALAADRFDRDKQTEAVVTMARLAQELRADSRFAEARLAANAAEAFFDGYESLDRDYAANDRRFAVSAAAKAAAEQNRQLAARPEALRPFPQE
ncbi:O-antigen ligase family protein [Paenibacillus glycinis]|uniref:O-antigen ligase-related domain-containing protein n=1 Tax=Paenibacillus glycinis TaxID=2697035 RepID=A0ABW9XMC5_9BACL|nr:O-antigen ligase family protein [Paenibacillus glycinis]NBD23564.1 hypothetical protein [Paenibacillus glycinis]